ncbi:MAG: N-acetylneuraminate synthase family protein [Deltaproteobacteria bacterium]|nr:N-acetylneuraminate synthase family protein [Deltaproteobacteria bacterium]
MRKIAINGEVISDASDCYVIAEIGHNHQGSVEKAQEMIRIAKESGANAVKFQKRNNRDLYTEVLYNKPYDHENSFGKTYGEHREALEFGRPEYEVLLAYAKEIEIDMFATAFDFKSVDFLATLPMPAVKVASGDLKNIPLLRHIAGLERPVILSTGGGSMEDVQRAYDAIMPINPQLAILQCTAAYPCEFDELNLKVVTTFRQRFPENVIGLSDHDNGIAMSVGAYVLGARIIEKHFTLNRAWKGTDHAFSLTPTGLRKMVRDLRRIRVAMGNGVKRPYPSEAGPLVKMGKKLVVARDLPAGHALRREDIAIKSPGDGMQPYEMEKVLGRVILRSLKKDEDIGFEILNGSQGWEEQGK